MAYDELLDWAGGRPLWQRDALRRIALHRELTADDLEALRLQIEHAAGLPAENAPEAVPLAGDHLSHAASNDPKTVLASLGPVRHVDRLSPDQPPLRFAVNGVTLVYGPNASGKSGYCRIARRLCRSLSPVELHGDVYRGEAPDPPKVAVAFRVGGDDQPKEERIWSGDQEPPTELSRISVFDTATARVYVDKQRKIEFLPYELDLMNRLGLACRALDTRFRERLDDVSAAVNMPLPEGYHDGTRVGEKLASLVPETAFSDLPSEYDLRALGTWTAEKQIELDAVAERLIQDPEVMIRVRTEAKRALETVKEEIALVEDDLGDIAITAIREEKRDVETKNRAAEAAARGLLSDQPISDLGSETWRQMLKYAREFAATAFPDAPPPQLASGGLCVLCQQNLDEIAAGRMAAFDDFIAGRATEEGRAAARTLAERRDRILGTRVKDRREIEVLLAGYSPLTKPPREGVEKIAIFVEKAGQRLKAVKDALREDRYDTLEALDPLPDSPSRFVDEEIARLDTEVVALEIEDRDGEALATLQRKHAELLDQRRLSEDIEVVIARRNGLEHRRRLDECIRQCRLTAITRRITDRRRNILTPTLKSNLDRELQRLRLTHIPLDLSDRGQGAESIIEIALDAQQGFGSNSDVLSEGEQRALALACFLAELEEIGSDHGIIVDDPVSSLDHGRMEAVAQRLAEEARKGRQVIVFTHNILFHYMLGTEARRAGIALHAEWMSSAGNDRFGLIDDSRKPWQIKRVRERQDEIGQDYAALTRGGYDHTDQRFRPAVTVLYTKMRETWERIVEEILFNNVVQRFRPEVMTQRLKQAYIEPNVDYPAIFEGMKRCSHYSGHDPASELPPDLPDANRISRDIEDLKNFAEVVIRRHRQLGKARDYEKGVEPVLL